jgi:nitrogen regulatory protein PII
MKAVLITYNQSLSEMVKDVLEKMAIRGYTQWTDIKGKGSRSGEPHEGTHTWPELNNAHLCVVEDDQAGRLMEKLSELNRLEEKQGLRAFSWNIEITV